MTNNGIIYDIYTIKKIFNQPINAKKELTLIIKSIIV